MPFFQATNELGLSPQEQYLYLYHLNNLHGSGKVIHPNGDVSTMLQSVVTGPDGRFYNIPTVWDGQALHPRDAQQRAAQVGWDKWPSYQTLEEAEARYGQMHKYFDYDTAQFLGLR